VVILQALISFVGRSARKLLNAVFGWAVISLFGRSNPKQQTFLTVLVVLAVAWPIPLLGIAFPGVLAFALAFVPKVSSASAVVLRLVALALTLMIPIAVGLAIDSRQSAAARRSGPLGRMLRGFPLTLGIASGFVLMFVTVPVLRIASALKHRSDEHVPLLTSGDEYEDASRRIDETLRSSGIAARRGPPPWWVSAPMRLLRALGGDLLRPYLPEQLAWWQGPGLEIAQYNADLLIRGRTQQVAWTRGLLEEALAPGPGLATSDAAAQDLERQIQRVWHVFAQDRDAHLGSKRLRGRLTEIAAELGRADLPYEQWQIVYRKALQLGRALSGEAQLLQKTQAPARGRRAKKTDMREQPEMDHPSARPRVDTPTRTLIREAVEQAVALVKQEARLAKAELLEDLQHELGAAKKLGIAGICAIAGLNLLLVAAAFALALWMPAWLAALVVAAAVLILGAAFAWIGWAKRVKVPLARTRRSIKEDVRWIKERTA
jgi:hypothetical protein